MSAKTVHMIDETVLKTLRKIGPAMTYYLANRMATSSGKRHDTAIIRQSLLRLEKAGKVKRITDNRNIYKTQLMWEAVSADSLREGGE